MIAVPRPDGGVTIHGSMQCPYYIHKAMKRALELSDEQAVVIQAETGGGFGGKEEYPSIIAIHAALLAQQVRQAGAHDLRPPRGPRRDDQAPPGDRPLPHRRDATTASWSRRTSRWSWTAARTARSRRWSCRAARSTPAALIVCPNVRIRGRAVATNTPPNGAFRGFGAPQTEFAAEMQVNRIAEALGMSPLELRRRWVYRRATRRPTGQVLRESVAGEEVLERAAEAAEFERIRGQTPRRCARAARTVGARTRTPASASRWRGTAPASPAAARSSWRASRRSS